MSWAATNHLYSRLEPVELPALVAGPKLVPVASCILRLAYFEQPVLDHDMIFGHAVKAERGVGWCPVIDRMTQLACMDYCFISEKGLEPKACQPGGLICLPAWRVDCEPPRSACKFMAFKTKFIPQHSIVNYYA